MVSNDYFFYYPIQDQDISPELIREKGCLHNQKVILKRSLLLQVYWNPIQINGIWMDMLQPMHL